MKMRASRVLKKLRAGEIVCCTKINVPSAQVTEIAALAGFDCVWVDQEHIGQEWSVINSQVWSTKSHNTDIIVRVERGSYSDLVKPLEMDATGIMVPHVMSVEDAKAIVRMTKFFPVGLRAIDGGNADGGYTALDFNKYLEEANRERFVILQIEDPEPLKNLEAIAAVEGYDMLFFGPGDFSQGAGIPGQWDHPAIEEARRRIAEVAKRNGKYAGTVGNTENASRLAEMGYKFISVGADVVGLSRYFKSLSETFGQLPENKSRNSGAYK